MTLTLQSLLKLINAIIYSRSDLFIQAKLWNSNHRKEHVEPDLDATLKDLQTDYVDSFVIHWAMAVPSTGKQVLLRPNGAYPAHHSESKTLDSIDYNAW